MEIAGLREKMVEFNDLYKKMELAFREGRNFDEYVKMEGIRSEIRQAIYESRKSESPWSGAFFQGKFYYADKYDLTIIRDPLVIE